jgi:TonB family protein
MMSRRQDMRAIFRRSVCLAGIEMFAVLAITGKCLFAAANADSATLTVEQETAQSALGNKVEAGKMIFEKVIEAQGGRELFSNIKDTIFSAEYKILPQGTDMTAVYYTKLPDRLRIDMGTNGHVFEVRAFDGKSGWKNLPGGAVLEMTGPELEEFKNSALAAQGMLNPEMLNISPALEGRMSVEGQDYLVISYSNWGGFDTVYALIDPHTFLPYKFINLKSDGRTEVINKDYREIDGLKLPFSFTLNIDNKMLLEMSIKEWKFNSGLEDSFFEKAAVAVGSAWGIKDLDRLSKEVSKPELIHRVEPVYPELAKRARISGNIKLRITIDEEGKVQDIRVIDGNPLLNGAAVEAVQQWRYTPAIQDGKPIPVTTTITLTFRSNR